MSGLALQHDVTHAHHYCFVFIYIYARASYGLFHAA